MRMSNYLGWMVAGVVASAMLQGCSRSPTVTWRDSQISPDKRWVSTARSEIIGGIGGEFDQTIVTISAIDRPNATDKILVLSHEYPTIRLKMKWVSPRELIILYKDSGKPGDHVDVLLRADLFGDVAISAKPA